MGLPSWVLGSAVVLSLFAVVRPKTLGWIALFLLMTTDQVEYTFTRFEQFGSWLNLFDVFTLSIVLSALVGRQGRRPVWPPYIGIVSAILALGAVVSLASFKPNYDTFRAFKFALYFPLGLVAGANWFPDL